MSRRDWADSLERYEAALEPHTGTTPSGEQYLLDSAPRGAVKMYDHLICVGLQHGWLDLHIDEGIAA